jgi:hypothetical protein
VGGVVTEEASMEQKLLVIDRVNMVVYLAPTATMADRMAASDALGAETIEWAIEQYGRCDGTDFTIIPEEWQERDI